MPSKIGTIEPTIDAMKECPSILVAILAALLARTGKPIFIPYKERAALNQKIGKASTKISDDEPLLLFTLIDRIIYHFDEYGHDTGDITLLPAGVPIPKGMKLSMLLSEDKSDAFPPSIN